MLPATQRQLVAALAIEANDDYRKFEENYGSKEKITGDIKGYINLSFTAIKDGRHA